MAAAVWSDEYLDAMRSVGDPLADEVVATLLASDDERAVQRLMDTLVRNDQPPPEELPPAVRAYFAAEPVVPAEMQKSVVAGEQFFAAHGPEILVALGCYSLPAAYAARKGVQVLYRTGFLARRPNRRLFETTQMVVDVLSPGGLGPNGRGLRTAQKVRLMHAAVRHLIRADTKQPWDAAALGVPINQEDLAGTLMTFTQVVLDGLKTMRSTFTDAEAQAYLDAWRVVGGVMGLRPELIPADLATARLATTTIQRRQIAASDEGKAMTAALLEFFEANLPGLLKDLPPALMRMFLAPYPGVADDLGIPEHRLADEIVEAAVAIGGEVANWAEHALGQHAVFRRLGLEMIQMLINVDRGGVRSKFHVPTDLYTYWKLPAIPEPTIWQRLGRWLCGLLRRIFGKGRAP